MIKEYDANFLNRHIFYRLRVEKSKVSTNSLIINIFKPWVKIYYLIFNILNFEFPNIPNFPIILQLIISVAILHDLDFQSERY